MQCLNMFVARLLAKYLKMTLSWIPRPHSAFKHCFFYTRRKSSGNECTILLSTRLLAGTWMMTFLKEYVTLPDDHLTSRCRWWVILSSIAKNRNVALKSWVYSYTVEVCYWGRRLMPWHYIDVQTCHFNRHALLLKLTLFESIVVASKNGVGGQMATLYTDWQDMNVDCFVSLQVVKNLFSRLK